MSSRPILASLIAGLLAAAGPAIAADSSDVPSLRRFALVASANDGGPGRARCQRRAGVSQDRA